MHHGISDYGHYITVRKLENKWFHISDESKYNILYIYKKPNYYLF